MKIIKENHEDLVKISDILTKSSNKLASDLETNHLVSYEYISSIESSLKYYLILLNHHGEDLFKNPSMIKFEIKRVNDILENLR